MWRLGRGRRFSGKKSPRGRSEASPVGTPREGWAREELCLFLSEGACGPDRREKNLIDSVVVEECFSATGIGDENKFYRPFRRVEGRCSLVGLFMRRDKPHVPRRDPDEG